MFVQTIKLLNAARRNGYAVGAFNIYNLEGATAVVGAAEKLKSPVILQLLPSAIDIGGSPLIAMCFELARCATVPVSVHLDHCPSEEVIDFVLKAGLASIMADGSHLPYQENIAFTKRIVVKADAVGGMVEAELGKLSGEEDGLSVDIRDAKMTDPDQAVEFLKQTGASTLAVCIGNIHGIYHTPPDLDFERLEAIARQVQIPLVLHGTSGLPDRMIQQSISLGISKFNVNTEIRNAFVGSLTDYISKSLANSSKIELVKLMRESISAMREPVQSKLHLFCSANKAHTINI